MDRRQRKSREAIFRAFSELLSKRPVEQITVGQIIQRADVGRATFYAHFEAKDALLQALCGELFCHVFDAIEPTENGHRHIFECQAPESVFEHLFRHLEQNDHHIMRLLTCRSNGVFVEAFRKELVNLLRNHPQVMEDARAKQLPEAYWLEHVADAFLNTVRWWCGHKLQISAEQITEYFLTANQIRGS